MKEIPLTQGKFALVDDDDFEVFARFKWHAIRKRDRFYVATWRDGRDQYMHRILLPSAKIVDHIDNNPLNNQRSNLRESTFLLNSMNRGPQSNNSTGFKGVRWFAPTKRWRAITDTGGRTVHIGYFGTAEEAARAYDKRVLELYGEHAWLNFPS